MPPPVPAECDQCHKALEEPLLCSRCRGYAYCSSECQAKHWIEHRFGCSSLPKGKLAIKEIAPNGERDTLCGTMSGLLRGVLGAWAVGPGRRPIGPAQPRPISRLMNPALDTLIKLDLGPNLSVELYPGRPRPHKDDLRHRLYNFLRLAFLHQLSHLDPEQHASMVRAFQPRQGSPIFMLQDLRSVHSRLHGPKILAVPDQLSLREYATLTRIMAGFCQAFELGDEDLKWMTLNQIWQQGLANPELLDYVPE